MTFRALLFCHDGTSLGHLQFLCRIADGLHPDIACLIVTGMREIDRLIPRTSEYLKLPNWDYLLRSRAESRGSAFSFDLDADQAKMLRSELLRSTDIGFAPDVIFVDYLPFGQRDELSSLLQSTSAVKYFIHRGVPDTSDAKILAGEDASGRIARSYDRFLVTLPPGFRDVALQDGYSADAASKIDYVISCATKRGRARRRVAKASRVLGRRRHLHRCDGRKRRFGGVATPGRRFYRRSWAKIRRAARASEVR